MRERTFDVGASPGRAVSILTSARIESHTSHGHSGSAQSGQPAVFYSEREVVASRPPYHLCQSPTALAFTSAAGRTRVRQHRASAASPRPCRISTHSCPHLGRTGRRVIHPPFDQRPTRPDETARSRNDHSLLAGASATDPRKTSRRVVP